MVTNRHAAWGSMLLLASAAAVGREAATPAACQAAGAKPPIAEARHAASQDTNDLRAQFRLADAWSDAGCFGDALQVLVAAKRSNPNSAELETRLRVARSVVGEEHFFDNLDRAEDQARLKRDSFRCTSLADADACAEALRDRPDDAALWAGQGDAFMRGNRPQEALSAYRHAATLKPEPADLTGKILAAQNAASGSGAPAVATPPAPVASRKNDAAAAVRVARVPPAVRAPPTATAPSPPAVRPPPDLPPRSASNSNVEAETHSH